MLSKILGSIMSQKRRIYRPILRRIANFIPNRIIRNKLLNWSGIHVGKNTNINRGCYFVDSSLGDYIWIEERVSVAPGAIFIATSYPDFSKLKDYGYNKYGKIIIKDDVWIGAGAIILPEVKIGKCSIIGAGAVVTKDIPEYSVAVGIPAKKIKDIRKENKGII